MIIYGIHPVAEALKSGRVREVRVSGSGNERVRALLAEAEALGIRIRRVAPDVLARAAGGGVHQGVVADVGAAETIGLEDLVAGGEGVPLIVVLDGVEDPHNLGAILRSVDAAGATGIVRQTRRAAPLDGAAAKASAGAVHHVRVADVVNVARAVEDLKAAGVWTVGLDAEGEIPYHDVDLTLPTAVVLGAEGHGLRRLVRERCDVRAAIPMAGHVGSLNVSVAAAVVLFEAVRQRRSRGRS
ncbi:MAG: 23S rRNA (guanosine(2251)-2'-O)-methyltransferase RlmB [Vicinamibacterales bacterium]|nr:23S rRNA (guanosine(2251)-2'-O)-methyltransferase RlmB [Vicinamibacterales bacterium]